MVSLEAEVEIEVHDPSVITRVTGPEGDEWRSYAYDLHTRNDVLQHLAYNCAINGQSNASSLDGWADLPKEAVSMHVVGIEELDVREAEQS